jgi:hypothetical protein
MGGSSRTSQHFMEPEGSIPCSQEPSTGPYPEPYHCNCQVNVALNGKVIIQFKQPTETINASGLYSDGSRFKSRRRHQLSTEFLQPDTRIAPQFRKRLPPLKSLVTIRLS